MATAKVATKDQPSLADMIEKMPEGELQELRAHINTAIITFQHRRKKEALTEVQKAAEKYGFKLADLLGGKPFKVPKPKRLPRYRNPEDATKTWSGLGRRPQWVSNALASGKTLGDLSIL